MPPERFYIAKRKVAHSSLESLKYAKNKTTKNQTNKTQIPIQTSRHDGRQAAEDLAGAVPRPNMVMEKGSYKGRLVDIPRFKASRFNPYFFLGPLDSRCGCGASALALLTGISPAQILVENNSVHFPDEFMLRFLRRHGCTVQELTQCNVSASDSKIGPDHIVLLSQLFRRNEATWGVIFSGVVYVHNFAFYHLDNLSLLNKPVLSAHLVIHPHWQLPESPKPEAAPKLKPTKKRLSIAALGLTNLPGRT